MSPKKSPLVYDVSAGGHRLRDAGVVASVIGGEVLIGPPRQHLGRLIAHPGVLIWQTADYQIRWYSIVAAIRALTGRRTIGICYRNNNAVTGNRFNLAARRLIFRLWNALPCSTALTTCPSPRNLKSGHFLYDTEWWDLRASPLPDAPPPALGPGRTVMLAGDPSHLKGVDFFIACAEAAAKGKLDWQFTVIGAIDALTPERRARLLNAGVVMMTGPADDAGFVACLRAADLLWCCYDPVYDQSSGVFGRSLQIGKATIVRAGSLLHGPQSEYGAGIAVPYGDIAGLLAQLDDIHEPLRPDGAALIYEQATRRLRAACG